MGKKSIVFILFFVLLLSSVYSADDYYYREFSFTGANSSGFVEAWGVSCNPDYSNDDYDGTGTCAESLGVYQDLDINASEYLNFTAYYTVGNNNCQVALMIDGSSGYGGGDEWKIYSMLTDEIRIYDDDGTYDSFSVDVNTSVVKFNWIVRNASYEVSYGNNNYSGTYDSVITNTFDDLILGLSRPAHGDEMDTITIIWGKEQAEVSGPSPQGTLTINHNLVNTSTNVSTGLYLTYNGTIADTGNIFNCSLYNGSNIVQSQLNKDLSLNQSFFINTNEKEEDYVFKIECFQAGEVNDTTTSHFYQIDSKIPDLLFTSSFSNNSNHVKDTTLSVSYTFTDSNIYAVNVSWFDSSDSLQQNFFIDSLTGSSYSNTTSKLLADTCSNCSIRFEAWDSHTKNEKEDYQYLDYGLNDLRIQYKQGYIWFYSDDVKSFDIIEKDDRYSLVMETKPNQDFSLFLYSDKRIDYLSNSDFQGHFIIFDLRKWVDFVSDDLQIKEIEKINDYEYKIKLYTEKNDVITDSIGDLNYAIYGYNYNVISQDTLYLSEISENTEKLYEAVNMIYFVVLWAIVTIGGVYFIRKGFEVGLLVYFTGFILDLIILGKIYLDFVDLTSSSNVGFLFSLALAMLIPTWLLARTWLGLNIKNLRG